MPIDGVLLLTMVSKDNISHADVALHLARRGFMWHVL